MISYLYQKTEFKNSKISRSYVIFSKFVLFSALSVFNPFYFIDNLVPNDRSRQGEFKKVVSKLWMSKNLAPKQKILITLV